MRLIAHEYIKDLKERARGDKRIVFTGFVFGRDYRSLQQNAYCYDHATEVGGTHPALLEAMGFGNCVLTLAAPENMEASAMPGIAYADEADLADKLQKVLRDGSLVQSYRNRAQARVQQAYDGTTSSIATRVICQDGGSSACRKGSQYPGRGSDANDFRNALNSSSFSLTWVRASRSPSRQCHHATPIALDPRNGALRNILQFAQPKALLSIENYFDNRVARIQYPTILLAWAQGFKLDTQTLNVRSEQAHVNESPK
jgi:hypothetical protein